ncbi:MAG: DUF1778 domain-containing protein [Clostridiales bacterium]|nr:DUF1778 domain-containing protein [Clostridiales bacterium]
MGSTFTEAQARAQKNYRAKTKCIQITLKPEEKEKIRVAAVAAGMSLNGFIISAVNEKIEREESRNEQ